MSQKEFDYEGYHRFKTEDGEYYGSFEVIKAREGWYWQACFPGCLPDGDMFGPFEEAKEAFDDAREGN